MFRGTVTRTFGRCRWRPGKGVGGYNCIHNIFGDLWAAASCCPLYVPRSYVCLPYGAAVYDCTIPNLGRRGARARVRLVRGHDRGRPSRRCARVLRWLGVGGPEVRAFRCLCVPCRCARFGLAAWMIDGIVYTIHVGAGAALSADHLSVRVRSQGVTPTHGRHRPTRTSRHDARDDPYTTRSDHRHRVRRVPPGGVLAPAWPPSPLDPRVTSHRFKVLTCWVSAQTSASIQGVCSHPSHTSEPPIRTCPACRG
jgi:hypothetical protein